jgi:hypothetical protein
LVFLVNVPDAVGRPRTGRIFNYYHITGWQSSFIQRLTNGLSGGDDSTFHTPEEGFPRVVYIIYSASNFSPQLRFKSLRPCPLAIEALY